MVLSEGLFSSSEGSGRKGLKVGGQALSSRIPVKARDWFPAIAVSVICRCPEVLQQHKSSRG